MSILVVKNIHTLVTMDEQRREINDGALIVQDGVITFVGKTSDLPPIQADQTLILKHHIVIPGLINTHHHMYQSLTRVIAQQEELFNWLVTLYPIWANLTGEMAYVSAKLAMAELILSGCTSSSDHLYLYPNDVKLDDTIRAAQEIGMRFHPTRGSMSVGESKGGLPPDRLVEDEAFILKDTQRLIESYHDSQRYAMLRVGVAPCSPFSVSQDLMRESAKLARAYGVRLHTHLAENVKDVDYSLQVFGMRPGDYAEDVGWVGDDVWHAHCVQLNDAEIQLFARTGTGVCHCPCSNMRLASGIAPIRQMLDQHVKVGLGVDGSASNDSGHLLNEARTAMLLQRIDSTPNPARLSAREALELATLGGAAVLGRDDIGALKPNMAGDFAAYRIDTLAFAGSQHDVVAGLVFGQSVNVDYSVINGQIVVKEGHIVTSDLPTLIEKHNTLSKQLINKG
ncbi:MAG: 8-oxoguanine deaminase [Chloroflexi bacterium]|nr:MAG: 8-oxoguanine deaminase [Chloroflexota bacterium]